MVAMQANNQKLKQSLISQVLKRRELAALAAHYPMAVTKLWRPHCHRFDGLGVKSERVRGCGQEMRRVSAGVWQCLNCNIVENRTAQIEPLISGLANDSYMVVGGNRAGKSFLACCTLLAYALGSDHPMIKQWMLLNNIQKDVIPKDPGRVLISALSYSDAIQYQRPVLSKLAPSTAKEWKWRAQDRARLMFKNGGEILSYSQDSGREKYQGASFRLCILDESHKRDIWEETMLRCADQSPGVVGLHMTPLKGISWEHEVFFEKGAGDPNLKTYNIFGLDNPYVSSAKLRRSVAHMDDSQQKARLFGTFGQSKGRVYNQFNREIHVVDSFMPPDDWPRHISIDFGTKNPFCALLLAHDEKNDVYHCCDEIYVTEHTTIEAGRLINRLWRDKYFPIDWIICDPESRDGRLTLARDCNLPNKPAAKHLGVYDTINIVRERLITRRDGTVGLKIHRKCKNTIREFSLYRYKNSDTTNAVRKQHDHAMDSLRYACASLYRYLKSQ